MEKLLALWMTKTTPRREGDRDKRKRGGEEMRKEGKERATRRAGEIDNSLLLSAQRPGAEWALVPMKGLEAVAGLCPLCAFEDEAERENEVLATQKSLIEEGNEASCGPPSGRLRYSRKEIVGATYDHNRGVRGRQEPCVSENDEKNEKMRAVGVNLPSFEASYVVESQGGDGDASRCFLED